MAADNLKDFAIQWSMLGMVFFSLLSFAIIFVAENNSGALGEYEDKLSTSYDNFSSSLIAIDSNANIALNGTSENNPEVSDQGSMDSVATAYRVAETPRSLWTSTKLFFSYMFAGEAGVFLITVLGGLLGFAIVYYVTKWIRIGQ